MRQGITPPDEMNKLYDSWEETRNPALYDKLLQAIIDNTFHRFVRKYGEDYANGVSILLAAKIFRALPGYTGDKPLKPYDRSRGTFNAFLSTMAKTTMVDYLRSYKPDPVNMCHYANEDALSRLVYRNGKKH